MLSNIKIYINKDTGINILKSILATFLMGTAINLFVSCELGSDPMTIFLDGFNRTTGVELSLTTQVLNIILLIIGFIINRKLIGINTIINVISLGICTELPNYIIQPLNLASQEIFVRIFAMITAQLLLSISLAWLQTFNKGISNMDAILFYVIDKCKIKYRTAKIVYDMIFIISGYLLGGIVGLGTIFSLLTTGYLIETIRKIIDLIQEKRRGIKNEREYC